MSILIDKINGLAGTVKAILSVPKPAASKFKFKDLTFFLQFVKPVWKIGALSVLMVMMSTAISALLPMSSKIFIDFVIQKTGYAGVENFLGSLGLGAYAPAVNGHLSSINFLVLLVIVVGVASLVLNILESYFSSIYQQQMTFNVQTSLFDHVLRFPMSFIKSKQTGYLMSRVSDDVSMMQYLFSDAVTTIISNLFYLIFGVAILVSMNARLAAIIACVIPVYIAVRYLFSDRIRALSRREREYNSEVSRDMQEAISGVEVVKSYAMEKREVGKIASKLQNVIRTRIARSLLMAFASSFMSGTMFALTIVVMFFGAFDIQAGRMTIGDYVAFITYIMFLSNAVNMLYRTYLTFQPAFASMDRLKEMFDIAPEFEWGQQSMKKPGHIKGNVRFDNVSFSYGSEPTLKNIGFEVRPGETVALVGHSGAGKTTLVSLLLKLYVPQSGKITLDGVDLNELDHSWLRQQISIVSQDIFLFNDTIENNIKYGRPEASREEVVHVAKKARIHDFIESLPDGYDTLIGERGTKLSVGQRQRISIARAFLKDTPLIILDEPTSAIDPETELHLKASLDELMKGRTTFIISHRMSLTDIANFIVVIEDGEIVERGTQKELEQKVGLYNRLRSLDQTHPAGT
ncbi:ABC transporter permease/ATP binding protein [Methanocella paludicola SANAE]|uniref:ABC transporter permease/ATP binding protein n=1 Tax=Methanocella paludicola (strain DSM 17711 / JCM 13418 / NBRC 101707 / SANAE) TaxID=304371 RepID=D1YWR4_METPS|nr:ABC transporter ATP-binding protein [Methanocella paludicola]BAI60886.1 ABC transporter permease/ATP binding protein [Methanocella paludicola SANAE]